jgi:hypothetical protein
MEDWMWMLPVVVLFREAFPITKIWTGLTVKMNRGSVKEKRRYSLKAC